MLIGQVTEEPLVGFETPSAPVTLVHWGCRATLGVSNGVNFHCTLSPELFRAVLASVYVFLGQVGSKTHFVSSSLFL